MSSYLIGRGVTDASVNELDLLTRWRRAIETKTMNPKKTLGTKTRLLRRILWGRSFSEAGQRGADTEIVSRFHEHHRLEHLEDRSHFHRRLSACVVAQILPSRNTRPSVVHAQV